MSGVVIGAAVVIGGLLALAVLLPFSRAFKKELRYVKMKMANSRSESERHYWEKRLKSLWRSLLPFCQYDNGHHDH